MFFNLQAPAAGVGSGMTVTILYMVVIVGVMYFIMIRPQRKQQKEQAARLSAMEIGDSVRTTGGFIGTVIDIDDTGNTIIVEFGNNKNCRIPMVKEAIVEVEKPDAAVRPIETKADKKKKAAEKKDGSEVTGVGNSDQS